MVVRVVVRQSHCIGFGLKVVFASFVEWWELDEVLSERSKFVHDGWGGPGGKAWTRTPCGLGNSEFTALISPLSRTEGFLTADISSSSLVMKSGKPRSRSIISLNWSSSWSSPKASKSASLEKSSILFRDFV